MKRIIGILAIVVFLFVICLVEELLVSSSLDKIKQDSKYLYNISIDAEKVNSEEIYNKTLELQTFWKEKEVQLSKLKAHVDKSSVCSDL